MGAWLAIDRRHPQVLRNGPDYTGSGRQNESVRTMRARPAGFIPDHSSLRDEHLRSPLDKATIIGIVAALSVVILAIGLGQYPLGFISIPGVLIVIGGTLSITL